MSPEVLNPIQTSYSGKLSDSWSLGIILYTLLVGRYPFHHPTIANMFARIARGKFQVPMSMNLSLDARILLRSLIRVKADERLLPDQILANNWFRQNENELNRMQTAAISMANFSLMNDSKLNKFQIGISSGNKQSALSSLNNLDDGCVPDVVVVTASKA